MISFNKPPFVGDELEYIRQAIEAGHISGDGQFTKKCSSWMEKRFAVQKVLMTTSGTSALDMASMMCGFHEGDEVILPSYTFSSTATSLVLGGAKLVFVDVRPDTMNIDENLIEAAITERTKAVMVMHYGGVACEMDTVMEIAAHYNLKVIEDAAQAIMSSYKGRPLGTIGDFGCYSFHETKNFSMGEGGAILIRDSAYNEKAEILREKGTNRSKFFRGEVDKYSWVDFGDSFLPSDMNSAYLYAQLLRADDIYSDRMATFTAYRNALEPYAEKGVIELQHIPEHCINNAHLFYIKFRDLEERTEFIRFMRSREIGTVFHYVPLHSSVAGKKYGRFHGEDIYTTKESERLVRLPMYYGMAEQDRDRVIESVIDFINRSDR